MSTELSTTVITETHLSITDIMLAKVVSMIQSKPEVKSYGVNTQWESTERVELELNNVKLLIQVTSPRN